jgi:hypothetical protein
MTVGEDAATGSAPVKRSDLNLGIVEGFPEHLVPGMVREGLLCDVSALHAAVESIK